MMEQDQEKMEEYSVCDKKHRESKLGLDFENGSYGLRENPKKSWKFSGAVNLCKICGKGFNSRKALFGHLRHHSMKKKENSIESENEACLKLVSGFQFDSENLGNFRKKRSIRRRSDPELNSLFIGFDSQEIELGMCLLMLPKGIQNWVRSEVDSANFSEKSSDENGRITDEDDGLKLRVKKAKYSSCASGSTSMSNDGDEAAPMAVESCPASCSDSLFTFSKNAEFKCKNCTRSFESYQALGGHCANHRKALKLGTRKIENPKTNEKDKNYANCCRGICAEMGKMKEHKCPICFKVFGSGQALGGHKRAHISKNCVIEFMN